MAKETVTAQAMVKYFEKTSTVRISRRTADLAGGAIRLLRLPVVTGCGGRGGFQLSFEMEG